MTIDFDRAIGTAPPSGISVDDLVRQGRRTMRRRRLAAMVGGGVAVVLAATMASGIHGRVPSTDSAASPAISTFPSTFPTTLAPPVPTAAIPPIPHDIGTRLNNALADLVHTHSHGATAVKALRGSAVPLVTEYEPGHQPRMHSYTAAVVLKDSKGLSTLYVQMYDYYPFAYSCDALQGQCEVTRLPSGENILRATDKRKHQVVIGKVDGTVVKVESNVDGDVPAFTGVTSSDWNLSRFGKTRDEPLFTTAELEQIATDPRLCFHQ
jgi:hypothetical protein